MSFKVQDNSTLISKIYGVFNPNHAFLPARTLDTEAVPWHAVTDVLPSTDVSSLGARLLGTIHGNLCQRTG